MPPTTSPYGSWASPITTDLIVAESVGLGQIALDGGDVYWAELRPMEAGRQVVVKRTPDGAGLDVTPTPFNVRTRVHEYGGGAYAVSEGRSTSPTSPINGSTGRPAGQEPCPITPEGDIRHADFEVDLARSRLVCVQENHSNDGEPVNSVVAVPMDTRDGVNADPEVLVSGSDFYSSPRLSPDGSWLCWLSWNHPNMPWDGTELWVGELDDDGKVGERKLVAGGSRRVHLPTGVGSRRTVVLRVGPDRVVEPLPVGQPNWPRGRRVRSADAGGVRPAAVGIRSKLLRVRLGGPGHLRRQPQWGLGVAGRRLGERAMDEVGHRRLLGDGPVRPAGCRGQCVLRGRGADGAKRFAAAGPGVGPTARGAAFQSGAGGPGVPVRAGNNRVSYRERVDGPRVLLSAPEPGLYGAGGSQATVAAEEPRRSHGSHVQRA